MLMWEYIIVFFTSFSITSYCVYNNCLNLDDEYYEDKNKYYKLKKFDDIHDIYKLEEVEESDY